jgi:hypothetical protein
LPPLNRGNMAVCQCALSTGGSIEWSRRGASCRAVLIIEVFITPPTKTRATPPAMGGKTHRRTNQPTRRPQITW